MTSISSSFVKQINTKYEAWRLIHDPIRLFVLLYSKYGDIEEDMHLAYANQLIFNLPTKLNCRFKEIKYTNLTRDYLKRSYKHKESMLRIPKLSDYYKNYHLFFCRPILRHNKLGRIMSNYQDKKAEIFYKNNYKDSKENFTAEKEENIIKKNSSLSNSSFDNITNNKIIFDKYTKKMLDKSETDLKNNNYYNTLNLETSRSNLLSNNGLISKRNGGSDSFEKCIHALMEYQYNKNKKYKIKSGKKVYLKNKKIKNIIINNSAKSSQIKKIISQSHRSTNKSYNFKIYNQYSKLLNKNSKLNSTKNSQNNIKININTAINKLIKHKKKKRSLYALTNTRYNTSSGALIGYKINKINNNLNQNILKNIKENNINYPITTTHKESKKNRTHFFQSSNSSNNNSKLTNFNEYLIQSQKNNEKNLFNKKNCLSNIDSQNLYFNFINHKNNNRITKKKVTLNKNIKINTTNANYSTQNMIPTKHSKNKTFDYNTINNSNNYTKTDNIICTEEFNESIKKNQKKKTFIIHIDNNNLQKGNNNSKSNAKTKANLASPASNRLFNKISITQANSKEKIKKMRVKKVLPINVSCNLNKIDKNQKHKKNVKSSINTENINNTFNFAKPAIKIKKNNICLSPHQVGNNNLNLKNIGSNLSPTNQLFKNIIYFKTNISHNKNNNNIYVKKSINKDSNFIKHKKNNTLMNSCNFNFNKEKYQNISLSQNINISNNNLINNTTNNINTENRKHSRNKKLNLKANFNYSKKSQINSKNNSSLNNNKISNGINYHFIINSDLKNNLNNNGNINISIGKSNINIKDSILHIDKIYIKKENNKRKNSKLQKLYENNSYFLPKKSIEMNLNNNLIKVDGKNIKKNKEFIKTVDFSPKIKGISNNIINVHRNFNLITNKNIKEIKRKIS